MTLILMGLIGVILCYYFSLHEILLILICIENLFFVKWLAMIFVYLKITLLRELLMSHTFLGCLMY